MKLSTRSIKLGGVLQEQIPAIIDRYTTPDEVGFLTVAAVEVSGDLGVADVFVNAIGGPRHYLDVLTKIAKKVAHEASIANGLRRTLVIRFKENQAPKHVERVNKQLSD